MSGKAHSEDTGNDPDVNHLEDTITFLFPIH